MSRYSSSLVIMIARKCPCRCSEKIPPSSLSRLCLSLGSIIERKDKHKRLKELGGIFSEQRHGHFLAIMITKLEEYLDIFYERGFQDIVKIGRASCSGR